MLAKAKSGPLAQLAEHLTFNQVVAGSKPARLTTDTNLTPDDLITLLKGYLTFKNNRNVALDCRHPTDRQVSCECEGSELTTLSEALSAYRICAKAEGLSPKTVEWVTGSVGYFADFLGDEASDLVE